MYRFPRIQPIGGQLQKPSAQPSAPGLHDSQHYMPNLFRWKESRAYARAEAESYRTFLANQVLQIENLFYLLSISVLTIEVLQHYIDKLDFTDIDKIMLLLEH